MKSIECTVKGFSLSDWIFELFKRCHRGKKNPIKREELLAVIEWTVDDIATTTFLITDREMRLAYEDLPICGSSKGLYLPETKAEIDEQVALHKKKIFSYWRKIQILKKYKIESDSVQKNLF